MEENLTEQNIPAIPSEPVTEPELPAPADGLAGPLADIDPEKLALLEERLAEFKKNAGKTVSGSEAPEEQISTFNPEDWEVEPELLHLYQRSNMEETAAGPKWTVIEHQYWIISGNWHFDNSGEPKVQNGVVVKDKHGRVQYHPKGLDHRIQEIINGPDGMLSRQKGWRLSALLPGSMGQGIAVMERQAHRALPDPKPIIKPEEQPLEKTTDEELARMQEKAQEWSGDAQPASSSPAEGTPEAPSSDASDDRTGTVEATAVDTTTEDVGHMTEEGGQ